jgi:hypothetical protein
MKLRLSWLMGEVQSPQMVKILLLYMIWFPVQAKTTKKELLTFNSCMLGLPYSSYALLRRKSDMPPATEAPSAYQQHVS